MIRLEKVSFDYDNRPKPVLQDLDLTVREGEYVALVGPNGCGKTTLLRHLNGLLKPSSGEVWVDDLNTSDPVSVRDIRRRVGMIFQNPDNQIVGMTVEEDVSFGPGNLGLPSSEIRMRVRRALESVGMERFARTPPYTLSGGEKQLLAVAGILAMDPAYIALDEPTSHLDPSGRKRVLDVIRELNRSGIAIIHVTHDMDEIVDADRIVVMDGGRIIMEEIPPVLFSDHERLRGLGLEMPGVAELIWHLRKMGAELRPDILKLDDACNEISSLIWQRKAV